MEQNRNISQMEPWLGEEERQAINDYLSQGGWVTEFKKRRHLSK